MRTLSYESGPIGSGSVPLGDTYILGRLIRRGGMSEIFEATHARLPGRFAVKILAPQLVGNREAFARFCREAEILSELRHPNVVQIFDFNTAPDERPYFVMEYLEGRTLETRLADSDPPTVASTVRLVAAAASALAAAHAHGIVHRDLKPTNIFLVAVDGQPDELIKVLDFGVSKARGTNTLLSVPTEIQGTPPYMAPEQVQGASAQVDGRTDQFALAAIAHRMLTGHDAFGAAESSAVLYQIAHEPAPPLARHLPSSWDVAALQAVLDRALAKNPADRYGGMMEFARAFEAAAERMPGTSIEPTPVSDAAPVPRVPTDTPRDPATPALAPILSRPITRPIDKSPVGPLIVPASEGTIVPLPIARSEREPVPIAVVRPAAIQPRPARFDRDDFIEHESTGTLDRIPVTHHRAAALGAVALTIAGLLIATGWYHRLPGTVPVVRQKLSGWLSQRAAGRLVMAPVAAPAAPIAATPTQLPPAALPTSSQSGSTDTKTAPEPMAAAPSERPTDEAAEAPAAANAPASAEAGSETTPLPAARGVAIAHRHREPRFRGHPGSIELAPAAEAADAPGVAAPAGEGFPIAPPNSLAEPPARQPLPPTEPPAAPTSTDWPTSP